MFDKMIFFKFKTRQIKATETNFIENIYIVLCY